MTDSQQKVGGWETNFPSSGPKEVINDVIDISSENNVLNDSDFTLLLKDATIRAFKMGDIILSQGDENECIYRIKSGEVKLVKDKDGKQTVLATMGAGQMFGEMSVLDKKIISATAIAHSHNVELYCIELPYLYELFKNNPGLSKRFHQTIAITLASRISKPFIKDVSSGNTAPLDFTKRTFSGILMASSLKKSFNENSESILARKWIKAWNRSEDEYNDYFTNDIVYRDPFSPMGISTIDHVKNHCKSLKETSKFWKWSDEEIFNFNDGFTIRSKIIFKMNSRVITEYAVVLATLTPRSNKIKRCEIYFDTLQLVSENKQDQRDYNRSASAVSSPVRSRPKDIKFNQKFGIENQVILQEYRCIHSGMSGKLYISQHYTCFYSKVFGMKMKEAVPFSSMTDIARDMDNKILITYDKEISSTKKSIVKQNKLTEFELSFSNSLDAEDAYFSIKHRWSEINKIFNHSIRKEIDIDPLLEGFTTLHEKLPEYPIKHSQKEKSIRITAPNSTETITSFEKDLSCKIISTYPRRSYIGEDGKVVIENEKQGSPICDQLCIERFENKTIIALADGCNWGKKPRDAALKASRTFCEYVKWNLPSIGTIREAGKLSLEAIVQAHRRIIEGCDSKWWECGTTTLIGGCLVEINGNTNDFPKWGFVCASVGDCKSFKVSSSTKKVTDVSTRRSGNASIDATDCGGRIGPFNDDKPDFRNLDVTYDSLDEGDVIIVVSDGVHDNLDPQSLGYSPQDLGLNGDKWVSDLEGIEEAKSKFMCEKIEQILFGDAKNSDMPVNLDPDDIVNKLIEYSKNLVEKSVEFMENNPDKLLPSDYTKFPGKLDHTSCACIKAKRTSLTQIEHKLDKIVIRMRHPVKGIRTEEENRDDPNESCNKQSKIYPLKRTHTISRLKFEGSAILKWLETNEKMNNDEVITIAQYLLNFGYIKQFSTEITWKNITFNPLDYYNFQVYEPIMTLNDWKLLLQGARKADYSKGEYIIKQDDTQKRLYHIIKGTCVTEKRITKTETTKSSGEGEQHLKLKRTKKRKSQEYIVVNTMGENETFGEISFLFDKASAYVKAESKVQLYIIDWSWINILFVKYPNMAGRFYHHLASLMAHRLKKQETVFKN